MPGPRRNTILGGFWGSRESWIVVFSVLSELRKNQNLGVFYIPGTLKNPKFSVISHAQNPEFLCFPVQLKNFEGCPKTREL
jgi:hypothetical protein